MIWASNNKTGSFSKMHSSYGNFKLIFNSDGTVVDPEAPADGSAREATEDPASS
jgi:hypothetical protein